MLPVDYHSNRHTNIKDDPRVSNSHQSRHSIDSYRKILHPLGLRSDLCHHTSRLVYLSNVLPALLSQVKRSTQRLGDT